MAAKVGNDPNAPMDDSDKAAKLAKCKALEKLKKGELHAISMENAQELFDVLDSAERGTELSTEDLRVLRTIPDLHLSDEDIDNLIHDCDKDDTGKISLPELYQALHQGSLVYKTVLNELGQGPKVYNKNECTRDELLLFLNDEDDRMESLCSLPITIVAFLLFFALVNYHLEIKIAFKMQNALQGEVEGEGKPYIGTYVHDVPTFWVWMKSSYVSAQFKSSKEKLTTYPYPGRFAAYNQIIGGTQVVKHQINEAGRCAQSIQLRSFYDSLMGGRCHKGGDGNSTSEFLLYHEDAGDIVKHLDFLEKYNWVDQNTVQLDFTSVYYNAHLGAITDFHLTFDWNPAGDVKILFQQETFIADPYYAKWIVAIDVVFGIILIRMFYSEFKEMVPRLLNGLDGFIQYWEFWNVVDWLNIVFGALFFTTWGMICTAVSGGLQDKIAALPTKTLDQWVVDNQTYFTPKQLEAVIPIADYTDLIAEVHTASADIAAMHANLRIITFFYSFTLMLKFFKAFRANPRLNIVIMTMQDSAVDIIHFGIVFLTIFCVFSLMANVIFGQKMKEFSTIVRSFFYCWRILLGDFDVDTMEAVHYYLANVWFLGFQIMVMMILLNMLLAIIMDTYSGVVGKDTIKKTIWTQTREAVNTVRETRGHLSLLYIICEMEDEDQKAHPGERVNSKSLRKAFERDKMTRANAEYLIRKTNEYLADREEECELKVHDAVRLVGQTKTMVLKIAQDTSTTLNMLKMQERAPIDARHDAIMAGLEPDDPHVAAAMKNGTAGNLKPGGAVPVNAPGAPQMNNANMNNMQPGMNNQMGPQGGMQGGMSNQGMPQGMNNQMGMQGNMQGNMQGGPQGQQGMLQQDPFAAANAQAALMNGTLSTTQPLQNSMQGGMGNTPGNTGQGFGNTGQSSIGFQSSQGLNNTMNSAMSGNQSMGQQGGGMNNQQGGGMNNQAIGQILQGMQQMQSQMQSMQEMVCDQRNYIEQRDSWLETRMSQLDRRCQKVEVLSDRLYTLLRSFDVNDLAAVPREVTKALNMHFEKMDGGGLSPSASHANSPAKALRDAADNDLDAPMLPLPVDDPRGLVPIGDEMLGNSGGSGGHHVGAGEGRKLEGHMAKISTQMDMLISHAEATPQITRLLWRMDLNLRQLTGNASNLPQQQMAPGTAGGHSSSAASDSAPRGASKKGLGVMKAASMLSSGSRSSSKNKTIQE